MDKYLELFNGLDIAIGVGGKLRIEGRDTSLNEFRNVMFDVLDSKSPVFTELLLMARTDKAQFNQITKTIYDKIKWELTPKMSTSLTNDSELENLTPVVSMKEGVTLLVDESRGIVSDVDYSSWIKCISPDLKKAIVNSAMPMAKFVFNPYSDQRISRDYIDNGTRDILYINKYSHPAWRVGAVASDKCPTFLSEFLEHLLCGDKEQIEYCLKWMAHALVNKNETYLVLNGDKGVGKNTLYEIMKAVIGAKYSVTAPQSLTTSHFNSVLQDRRLILLDEYKITRINHLFLKKIINKYQTIEKKGFDANTEEETFNSFMIFHNDPSDMYLEKDDRRFSVLDITSKNLLELWSEGQIDRYLMDLTNPNSTLVKEIGEYLLGISQLDFDPIKPFKGKKFHEIVEYHMPQWLQIVVAMIENGEVKEGVISFKKEIEKKVSQESMGRNKISWRKSTLEKVLREYRYKDKYSIGTILGGGRQGLELEVNPVLLDLFNYKIVEDDEEIL